MTSDTHMVLGPDLRFQWWSTRSDPTLGSWSCSNDVLSLSFDDGTELERRYARTGDEMAFPGDSRYGYWERL